MCKLQATSEVKKYGGLAPKKKPLISKVSKTFPSPLFGFQSLLYASFEHLKVESNPYKFINMLQDNERAFFDSADWALCKVFAPKKLKINSSFLIWIDINLHIIRSKVPLYLKRFASDYRKLESRTEYNKHRGRQLPIC